LVPFLLAPYGPLAHLVERLVCTEEVTGSNPVGSTTKQPKLLPHPAYAGTRSNLGCFVVDCPSGSETVRFDNANTFLFAFGKKSIDSERSRPIQKCGALDGRGSERPPVGSAAKAARVGSLPARYGPK
jgi:hypothetical protein